MTKVLSDKDEFTIKKVYFYLLECHCNTTGSMNIACSRSTGQCNCQPGVNGRQCDNCMKQHYDFSSDGCTGKSIFLFLQLKARNISFLMLLSQHLKKTILIISELSVNYESFDIFRFIRDNAILKQYHEVLSKGLLCST